MCPKTGWAYVAPSLNEEAVGDYLSQLLDMELGVTEWQCYFASVDRSPIESLDDFEDCRVNLLDGTAQSRTPRANKKAQTSAMLAPDSLPLFGGTDQEPSAFLGWLIVNWPHINKSFGDLSQLYSELSVGWRASGLNMDVLATSVALVRTELGNKSQDIEDRDVWTAIRNIRLP